VRPDPGGTPDDSLRTDFGCFGPSDKVSDWIPDRLTEGPTGLVSSGVDCSVSVPSQRWHCVIIP
jgi:hypothetical protein